MAFHSSKIAPAEVNNVVHDKQMTAIVATFKEWEYVLTSVEDQIVVYTDYNNLEYFNTTKILNRRQHHWADFLQMFNFKVVYHEGRLNEKVDALYRCSDYNREGWSNSDPSTFFRLHQYVGLERDILQP